jgi:hypothetical protein
MRFRSFQLLVAALGITALSGEASAATQYHLICRGSPESRVTLGSSRDFPGDMHINLLFNKYRGTKASVKTDGSHLAPGQCSWSTNVIASVYGSGVLYQTAATNLRVSVDWKGGPNDQHNTTSASIAYDPATSDANLLWLQNPSDVEAEQNPGTIFDADVVWHMYVTISLNSFTLRRAYSTPYPY